MKNNKKGNLFIFVFILINLALVIAYIVSENTSIMSNNLNFSYNSTEFTKNLFLKTNLNLATIKQYNSNWWGFVDNISCPENVTFNIVEESWDLKGLWTRSTNLTYNSGSIYCDFAFDSNSWKLLFNEIKFYEILYWSETKNLVLSGSDIINEEAFSGNLYISFPDNILPDWIDDNMNSDDFRPTSSWTLYPNSFIDDDIIPRLTIFSLVTPQNDYYNIFWNNYKTDEIIDRNIFNNENSGSLTKIWNVSSWNLIFNLSSSWNLSYKIKLVKFNKENYKNNNTLILLESFESWNLTQSGGYLQSDLSLSETKTWNEFEFNFTNNDYAIFVQNNWQENINIQLKWEENSSWKKIYINAIDESKDDNTIEILVNHIISYGSNYTWENYATLSPK